VISVIALVGVAGGGAFALASGDSRKDKRIARKVVHKLAPGLSVKRAKTAANADHATTADSATNADHASSADSATLANQAFSTFHDDAISMPDALDAAGNPIATLNIPQAGSYVIMAKLQAFNASLNASPSDHCTLTAGGDVDQQFFDVDSAGVDDQEPVPLQVVHTFDSPGSVDLRCTDLGGGLVQAEFTRITAIQVAHVTNTGF
jgi:hypothetical protein